MRKGNYRGCSSGKACRTVRMRHRFAIAYSIVFATALGWCAGGCDPVTRHKYLTYFVDGVPPLGSEQDSQDGTKSSQQGSEAMTAETEKNVWFVHEPARTRKTCDKCHEKWGTQNTAATARLIKPLPELCFDCHEEFSVAQLYVHGPVIAGECVFCHDPHKTQTEHLLKKEQPELCYRCHVILELNPIPEHPADPNTQCTGCHDPHGGSERFFLKQQQIRD